MHCHLKILLPQEVGAIIIPYVKNKDFMQAKWLAQGHTAAKCQTQGLDTWNLTAEPEVLTTSLNSFSFLDFLS